MLDKEIFLKEVIHGDKFRNFCDVIVDGPITQKIISDLCDKNCVIFCKTDYVYHLFEALKIIEESFDEEEKAFILVTHNSDYPINQERWNAKPKCIKKWYALNVEIKLPNLIPLPSGMERPLGCGYSSDANVLFEQMQKPREYKNLVYMNHNENNNLKERKSVTEFFKDKSWCTYRPHGISFKEYIANCYSHKFVISPPGNGIDCHRTWEALYMGAIPIVKESILTRYFRDLPILIVEDYSILDEYLLNMLWQEFKEKQYSCNKMKLSFWGNSILRDKQFLLEGK